MRRNLYNQVNYTVRFKSVFPNFDAWNNNLIGVGVDISDSSRFYYYLNGLIGIAWLKYNIPATNRIIVRLCFESYYKVYLKMKEVYDKNLEDMLVSTEENNSNTKNYDVNRTENDFIVKNDFLTNSNDTNDKNIKIDNIINNMDNYIKYINSSTNPLLFMIKKVMDFVLLPLQPYDDFSSKGAMDLLFNREDVIYV